MRSLANLGILGNFIGMLTDSRSFLSYARHDYFRRIRVVTKSIPPYAIVVGVPDHVPDNPLY